MTENFKCPPIVKVMSYGVFILTPVLIFFVVFYFKYPTSLNITPLNISNNDLYVAAPLSVFEKKEISVKNLNLTYKGDKVPIEHVIFGKDSLLVYCNIKYLKNIDPIESDWKLYTSQYSSLWQMIYLND